MNGKATEAPDKRFVGGAVPPTCTTSCGCVFCDIGLVPIKLRRQYVHHVRKYGKFIICPVQGIKLMSQDIKPGS